MRTLLCLLVLLAASCAQRPVSWTPALVEATQQNFTLTGSWSFTVRAGGEFGKRCDYLFNESGTYRKSCKPPLEESGTWEQADWDGHTFKLRLTRRMNLVSSKSIQDTEFLVTVASPKNDEISFNNEMYERL